VTDYQGDARVNSASGSALKRTLAMPKTAEPWSLTSLREKLIKIGAKVSATAAT
jgi:hypothetical protein